MSPGLLRRLPIETKNTVAGTTHALRDVDLSVVSRDDGLSRYW